MTRFNILRAHKLNISSIYFDARPHCMQSGGYLFKGKTKYNGHYCESYADHNTPSTWKVKKI